MTMSVEYSPSWEEDSLTAMNVLLREVDLAYNNDDEMVITMKM